LRLTEIMALSVWTSSSSAHLQGFLQAANHKRETDLISPRYFTARPRWTESQSERTLLSDVLYETSSTERNCGGILPSTTFSTNNYVCLIANVKGEFGAILRFFASPPTCLPQGHFYRPRGKKIHKITYAAEGEFRLPPIRNRQFRSDVDNLVIDRRRPPCRRACTAAGADRPSPLESSATDKLIS